MHVSDAFGSYAVVEKRIGETPLQALERYRVASELADVPMTYAGRLDPMASGKLLILIGEECKRRHVYDALDKEYEFEILLGARSDTADILGLAELSAQDAHISEEQVLAAARLQRGVSVVPYPAFSSKNVDGVPLFQYALEGRLSEIVIPTVRTNIYTIPYLGRRSLSNVELLSHISDKLEQLITEGSETRLGSDFRKGEVLERWKSVLRKEQDFSVLKFRATVSSGTYIRSLAERLGEELGTEALALTIHRNRMGRYEPILGSWGIWRKQYR